MVFEMCGYQSPTKVEFTLFNSLAGTGFLHGTQVALLAGVQGIDPGDEFLWESPQLAAKNGLEYSFVEVDDAPEMHPNAVLISFCFQRRDLSFDGELLGESTGGGNFVPTIIKDPERNRKEN